MAPQEGKKRHIVIVGAGAAGMVMFPSPKNASVWRHLTALQSCAATLANHPDKFKVTLLEKSSVVGGQATSIPLDKDKYGAAWMNNGVQGGSPVSTYAMQSLQCLPMVTFQLDLQAHIQLLQSLWAPTPRSSAAGLLRKGRRRLLDQLLPQSTRSAIFF
jgi:hypothetical protein